MALPYCEKFGFDAAKIQERLQWLELTADDHLLVAQLQQDLIRPHVDCIVDDFYTWLQTLDEARSFLSDDAAITRLKQTQIGYLRSLGIRFDQPDYFESRLRVGQAHVWVGLSLSLYQCAYRRLTRLILDHLVLGTAGARKLMNCANKIIALDMSLAIETYHLVQVRTLEESLARSLQQRHRLQIAASIDSLTGLANRETILVELEHTLAEAKKTGRPLVVAMVDIDHFKTVNDTHGHIVGDKVLIEVARRLQGALRDFDYCGRYGGEEFLLILNGTDLNTARKVAERVRARVAGEPINLQGLEVAVSISLGLSAWQPGEHREALVIRADQALYAAKGAGRNCIRTAD